MGDACLAYDSSTIAPEASLKDVGWAFNLKKADADALSEGIIPDVVLEKCQDANWGLHEWGSS